MEKDVVDPGSVDIAAFLTSWYGLPQPVSGKSDPAFDWIPDGLKWCHEMSMRWGVPLDGVKRLLPLSELSEEEGKFIFMADQGGWAWAFDGMAPLVIFEVKDDEPWRQLSGGWEDFFRYHVFTETIENAPFVQWSSDVSMSDVERVLASFQEISFSQSKWPGEGWRSYIADGMIADAGPKAGDSGSFAVTLGAKSGESLEYLRRLNGVDWRMRRN
ncbi:hypothetical protein I2W78_25440 [Streptomyces spinoverrucosus]|uniref:hypothetical protein n=1 Tax=Streptomyces spinoverrucosus TaxID=284043 RepID=UPI0018C44096|nr:hypothetical protein [Streptomyces spinoverrucosus]MBG0855095.1 hypothetical protein [Streptomyces spinoverrucosus]